jgi:hypothetical protein
MIVARNGHIASELATIMKLPGARRAQNHGRGQLRLQIDRNYPRS